MNIVRREGLEESLKKIGADVVVIDNNDLSKTVKNITNNANIKLAIDAVGGDQVLRIGDCLEDEANYIKIMVYYQEKIFRYLRIRLFLSALLLTGFWLMPWLQNMDKKEIIEMYSYLSSLIEKKYYSCACRKNLSN